GVDKDDLLMRDMFFVGLLSTNAPYVEADEKGRWSFEDVPQGTYIVSVEAPVPVDKPVKRKASNDSFEDLDSGIPDFSKGMIRGSAEVKIGDKDVDNVVIELNQGASIFGSVIIDRFSAVGKPVAVRVENVGPSSILNMPAYVNDDRSFVLQAVPTGSVRLDIY